MRLSRVEATLPSFTTDPGTLDQRRAQLRAQLSEILHGPMTLGQLLGAAMREEGFELPILRRDGE